MFGSLGLDNAAATSEQSTCRRARVCAREAFFMTRKLEYPFLLIGLAAIARIVPHAWNFTPVGAVGLFAGAYCKPKFAWQVPLLVLLLSDLVLGFYDPVLLVAVYAGFMFSPLIGRLLLARRRSVLRVGGAVWASATVFFLVSNLGEWFASYPLTLNGLIECYVLALPFYGTALIGDAIYASVLFGGYEVLMRLTHRNVKQVSEA